MPRHLIPTKQQPHSVQRKEPVDLQERLEASKQREAELEDARAALKTCILQPTRVQT